ncbi:uncharacterized protein UV8b_03085 [Ustilaginoidea virens]|uniref:Carbohydrate kinase PfkB domain-containing protein n=1 Tax=Ustilaginoidea virens TaxID=1159556 RepID=A0A8E5HNN9_USTVR|nr:uncharacterized protein UV8b_03085 [Ustilaginoidea virens]QUC18844.1 hypothetical protein UV8b_03085 [Ustilaginoidea virens]
MKHLILTGATYLDTILSVPYFPAEDSKLRATKLELRRGGNCANSLQVLQQFDLGDACLHLVSCLPREGSPDTERILSSFGPDCRIRFDHCLFRDEDDAASSYIVRSEASGSRTIVNYNGLPEMQVGEFASVVDGFREDEETWWHFEGRNPGTTLACIELIRRRHPRARISVEIEKPGRQGLLDLAARADIVFYSQSWAESRGYASAEECLRKEHRRPGSLGLCTWGAAGATAMSQATGEPLHCPVQGAADQISVIDPIGAGDTFIAGMLWRCFVAGDWPSVNVESAVSFAVALATLKVQQDGFAGLKESLANE